VEQHGAAFARSDPSNIARLPSIPQFPRLASPGPVLEQILAGRFPNLLVPAEPANRTSGSWTISYAFDQYFWQPDDDPKHGVGVFFGFGSSGGNSNPIQYAYLAGIGGKGVVPGRPDDNFGFGLARTQFSRVFSRFCASSSTSACNARMRSRCTTTPRLRRG
jgi:porin